MYNSEVFQHFQHIWRHFTQHGRNRLYDMATNLCVLCIDIFSTFGAISHSTVGTVCMTWAINNVKHILTPQATFPYIPTDKG